MINICEFSKKSLSYDTLTEVPFLISQMPRFKKLNKY